MKITTIETWESLEGHLTAAYRNAKEIRDKTNLYVSPVLFRGHADASWKLETTLERHLKRHVSVEQYFHWLRVIKPYIETATSQNWVLPEAVKIPNEPLSMPPPGYEFMIYVRHHGFPSPLLDWTRSPYIAAFFAFTDIEVFTKDHPMQDLLEKYILPVNLKDEVLERLDRMNITDFALFNDEEALMRTLTKRFLVK